MPSNYENRRLIAQQRRQRRRELLLFMRRLAILFAVLNLMILGGTIGFAIVEHVSVAYGFEWTLDTITTLGTIPDPHDNGGRILKVGLEIFGIGTLFYGVATVAEFFVSGQLTGLIAAARTQRVIDSYTDHYIVCGYGRVGRQAVRDLRAEKARYVVIDDNPDNRDPALAAGIRYIDGSPSDDQVLRQAGIERARGVLACLDSDSENVFIALTARELRSDVLIVARASAEESEKKMLRAGADRVISPYKASGSEMARYALHPQLGRAVGDKEYRIEEIEVMPNCAGAGQTIGSIKGQSVIVAVNRDGRLEPQPPPHKVLNPGDTLVALGTPEALEVLEGLFQPAQAPAPATPYV
jgi:voltage-gated potassium channel